MGIVWNLLLVTGVALVARSVLNARTVSWWRLLVAAFLGLVGGLAVALLFEAGTDLPGGLPDEIGAETQLVALPFQLVITMVLVVAFELVSSRPRRRRALRPVRPIAALRRRLAIAGRGWEVLRVGARHGLRSGWDPTDPAALAERARRLRLAIEDLGGVYVKLGQLLATRPDLVPPAVTAELARLQSSVTPLPFEDVAAVVDRELGPGRGGLTEIDPVPLGSASIAQVHAAALADGTPVVVKVRRPGLEDDVERDLAILDWVARTAERRSPAAARYGLRRIADEFAEALGDELDFRNEARHTMEMAQAVADFPAIEVPAIHEDATTDALLVMDRLEGIPLAGRPGSATDSRTLAEQLCRSQIRAMMRGDRFHGDPHAGNVLVMPDGRLGLLDFGMTGKLDAFGREFVLELLAGLRLGDPALMYEALLTGGSVDVDTDRDQVERAIAAFLSAHAGDELSARALTDLLRMAAELGIALPRQAAVMFRTIATLIGTLDQLSPGFPMVDEVADAAGVELRDRMSSPETMSELAQREFATLAPFMKRLPRHVDRIATQLERGRLTARLNLLGDPGDRAVLEGLVDKLVLALVGLGVLAISVLLIRTEAGPTLGTNAVALTEVLGWTGLFAGTVLVLRVLLDALRPPGHG